MAGIERVQAPEQEGLSIPLVTWLLPSIPTSSRLGWTRREGPGLPGAQLFALAAFIAKHSKLLDLKEEIAFWEVTRKAEDRTPDPRSAR